MGSSPSGILVYGYDLGGPDFWKLQGTTETGDYYNFPGFEGRRFNANDEYFEDRLLALVGIPDLENSTFKQRNEAKAKLEVGIERYGSYEYPNYLLGVKPLHVVWDYGAKPINIDLDHAANMKLDAALEVLNITPIQLVPRWILACFYG